MSTLDQRGFLVDPREDSYAHRFRIASNTKAFTSTVLLQLVGEGRLSLDDPVSRWLPGVVHSG